MANTFTLPASANTIALARLDWQDSLEALLSSFYGPVNPQPSNFKYFGNQISDVPNGTLFRSSTLGTLFIKDDLNHQNNPIYGNNFTRNGIGYIIEENIVALEANIANREKGEIIVVPEPNTRMYVKSSTGSTYVDIGIPPIDSINTSMIINGSINALNDNIFGPNIALKNSSQIYFGGSVIFVKNSTENFPIELRSETGNVVLGFTANGDSGSGIVHRREGTGVEILNSSGNLGPINVSDLQIEGGVSFSTFPTGSIVETISNDPFSGWLNLNGNTIGSASSGANHANILYETLFKLLWDNVSNTYAPVNPGRGANAQFDWDSNKTIKLLDSRGRSIIGTGTGSGLTARVNGQTGGEETHVLSASEILDHKHETPMRHLGYFVAGASWPHGTTITGSRTVTNAGGAGGTTVETFLSGPVTSNASASGHNNMQPWLGLNVIIKF